MCSLYTVFSISLLLGFEGSFTFIYTSQNTPSLKVTLLGLPVCSHSLKFGTSHHTAYSSTKPTAARLRWRDYLESSVIDSIHTSRVMLAVPQDFSLLTHLSSSVPVSKMQ